MDYRKLIKNRRIARYGTEERRPAAPRQVAAEANGNTIGSNITEADDARYLTKWVSSTRQVKDFFFAIPNGGSRHPFEARNLKLQGVKPGVPDYFLALPRNGKGGLFIELKRKCNPANVSEYQKTWLERLENAGYVAKVCYGWQSAAKAICDYCDLAFFHDAV